MEITQAVGLVAGGGVTTGGTVVLLARLLAASWIRELERRFKSIEAAVEKIETERSREIEDFRKQQNRLFGELRRMSGRLSYLNGQLAARGLVRPEQVSEEAPEEM